MGTGWPSTSALSRSHWKINEVTWSSAGSILNLLIWHLTFITLVWGHFHSLPLVSSPAGWPAYWGNQIQMCSVQSQSPAQLPPPPVIGCNSRCHNFPSTTVVFCAMASAHDRAVLQALFNPSTPFGNDSGLNQEEELNDDGECLWGSAYHVAAFYVYHFTAYWNYFCKSCSRTQTEKKKHGFNPSWFLGDISVFSVPRLSFECFFNLFISLCQTVALTRSCWSKWRSWSCGASQQQRQGICRVHFSCSARQSRSCHSEHRPITTGHRPCGCRETQQVPATNSMRNLTRRHRVSTHQAAESTSRTAPYQTLSCRTAVTTTAGSFPDCHGGGSVINTEFIRESQWF